MGTFVMMVLVLLAGSTCLIARIIGLGVPAGGGPGPEGHAATPTVRSASLMGITGAPQAWVSESRMQTMMAAARTRIDTSDSSDTDGSAQFPRIQSWTRPARSSYRDP